MRDGRHGCLQITLEQCHTKQVVPAGTREHDDATCCTAVMIKIAQRDYGDDSTKVQ
jgi:hypothetical protein